MSKKTLVWEKALIPTFRKTHNWKVPPQDSAEPAASRVLPLVLGFGLFISTPIAKAGTLDDWIRSFADSEIQFQRPTSNVPFQPLAFVDVRFYGDTEVRREGADSLSFDQTTVSQAAALPFLIGPRDVLVVGEWIGWSEFDSHSSTFDSFRVLSIGIPVGWLRQLNDDWQAAAFVMPLGNRATLADVSWSWEAMGGAFARYVQSDHLAWTFGFFTDIGPGETIYLPYLGATWSVTDQWTLSAMMPWPALLYAPSKNALFRFGAAPSGASWSIRPDGDRASFALDSWDLGLSAGHRVYGNWWLMLGAGIGGLRGLRVTDGEWREPEVSVGSSPYINFGIDYRPALPQ